MITFVFVIC